MTVYTEWIELQLIVGVVVVAEQHSEWDAIVSHRFVDVTGDASFARIVDGFGLAFELVRSSHRLADDGYGARKSYSHSLGSAFAAHSHRTHSSVARSLYRLCYQFDDSKELEITFLFFQNSRIESYRSIHFSELTVNTVALLVAAAFCMSLPASDSTSTSCGRTPI